MRLIPLRVRLLCLLLHWSRREDVEWAIWKLGRGIR